MNGRFFISSSSEQLSIGKALEATLEADGFEPTLWPREVHGASQYNLEALLREAAMSDFAIFVFAPDDQVSIRGETFRVVRDNMRFLRLQGHSLIKCTGPTEIESTRKGKLLSDKVGERANPGI